MGVVGPTSQRLFRFRTAVCQAARRRPANVKGLFIPSVDIPDRARICTRKIVFMSTRRFASLLLLVLAVTGAGNAPAAELSTYVIAAAFGYGVEECLNEGGECGQVVADAWCETQGLGVAVKFGRSDRPADDGAARPYFIICRK
jgi:hypothetical protein